MRVVDSILRACCGGRITTTVSHSVSSADAVDILEDLIYFGWMTFLLSLLVGLGVGVLYAVLAVRSPAPPVIALLGLLGMVVGEHVVLYIRS
jgi:XapX domain-containing protein